MAPVQIRRRFIRIGIVASFVFSLAACGGSPNGTPGSRTDLIGMKCTADPQAGLGSEEVCVDSGLRSSSFFSFANWGGRRYKSDSFGFNELIALYGEKVVCTKVRSNICRITPKARLIRETIDNILQNGRCEGLSTLGALYMQTKGPDPKKFGVDGVQSLSPSIDDFGDVIDYWWATQFLEGAAKSSSASRKSGVEAVLKTIVDSIANKRGATVGMYTTHGAHSVLPVAVTKQEENKFIVHVWDSNNPHSLGRILFDLDAKQWKFAGGKLNSNSTSSLWEGGDGSIDAVVMESRSGKPLMNISSGQKGTATVSASSSANRNLSLTITTKDGQKLVASSTGVTGAIPGVSATPLRNGDTSQILVDLPSNNDSYSLSLTSTSTSKITDGNTQLTISDDGAQAYSIAVPSTSSSVNASMAVDIAAGGIKSLTAQSPEHSVMSAATTQNLVSIPLARSESATIEDSSTASVDAVLTLDPADAKPQSLEIPTPANGVEQNVVIMRSSAGDLVALKSALQPVTINTDLVQTLSNTLQSGPGTSAAAEIPSAIDDVDVANFNGSIQDNVASVKTTVSAVNDSEMWIEFGPSNNWSTSQKTSPKSVKAGVDVPLVTTLVKLDPGTSYRYRAGVRINNFVVYSPYSEFVTTGTSNEDLFTEVSDASINAKSQVIATTTSSAVISSTVTTPINSKAWVEYAVDGDSSQVMKSTSQNVPKGTAVEIASVVNGLSLGQKYKFRLVVQARDAFGYSTSSTFTTGANLVVGVVPVSAISPVFTTSVQNIGANSIEVAGQISSNVSGRVQIETRKVGSTDGVFSPSQTFSAGSKSKVLFTIGSLEPNTKYMVRMVVKIGKLPFYGTFQTLQTEVLEEGDTSEGRIDPPTVIAEQLTETSAGLFTAIRTGNAGSVRYEYGVDNPSAILYSSRTFQVSDAAGNVANYTTDVELRAGTPYRVRAELSIDGKKYVTAFTKFVTRGSMNFSNYRASVGTPMRTASGADVSWSLPVTDVPSGVTFKVLENSIALCSTSAITHQCSIALSSFGTHSLEVVTYYNGAEVIRSSSFTIQIGGTPSISTFTFVSATTNSLSFTYSFNPQGETVQYGIEIRTAQDQFVKADQGGSTSGIVNGAAHLVSGLSPATAYKARLILIYGSNVVSGPWVNVSTS